MFSCVYTKHKKRKLKTWFDGFVSFEKGKMKLFDEDKKMIDSKSMNKLTNDIETFKHIIYIENLNEEDANEVNVDNEVEIVNKINMDNEIVNTTPPEQSKSTGRSNEDILNLFKCTK